MARKPWMKFYPSDWQGDPALRMCSIAARGVWLELLAIAHQSAEYGSVLVAGKVPSSRQLAVLCGCSERELSACLRELEIAGVFDRGVNGEIISRRMVRDFAKAKKDSENGKGGGNPAITQNKRKGVNPRLNQDASGGVKAHWNMASGLSFPGSESGCSSEVGRGEWAADEPTDFHPGEVQP